MFKLLLSKLLSISLRLLKVAENCTKQPPFEDRKGQVFICKKLVVTDCCFPNRRAALLLLLSIILVFLALKYLTPHLWSILNMELTHNCIQQVSATEYEDPLSGLKGCFKKTGIQSSEEGALLAEPSQSSFVLFSLCTPPPFFPPSRGFKHGRVADRESSLSPSQWGT